MNVSQLTHPGVFPGLFRASEKSFPPVEHSPYETDLVMNRPEGIVRLRSLERDALELTLLPHESNLYIPRASCRTTLSVDLLLSIMEHVNFAWLCDNVARHEEGDSVPDALRRQLFSYCRPEEFAGKRVLDFGCGDGASTMAMARMLPCTEIVGVDLEPSRIDVANQIKSFRDQSNVTFQYSPSGCELPQEIGMFDFIMLSAVYEHLLPQERRTVMPLLWTVMRPGARIFVNQTPYRYFPIEAHSTGLWFINYLPDRLAHFVVRHCAGRNQLINQSTDWNAHLRGGLRGATEREILRNLTSANVASARIMQPIHGVVRDRAEFWLKSTSPKRRRRLKQWIARGFRVCDEVWGTIPSANLEVVIEKLA